MKNYDIDMLKLLEQIQKVDAPPFMLTSIMERINVVSSNWITPKKAWSLVVAFTLLIILNAYAILQLRSSSRNERNLAQTFQLMPQNNFYE